MQPAWLPSLTDNKSWALPNTPSRAHGLFVIINHLTLVGKMGRRVGQVYNKVSPQKSKWILQLVRMSKRDGRGERYDQEILKDFTPVTVDREDIVLVYEGRDDIREANSEELETIWARFH